MNSHVTQTMPLLSGAYDGNKTETKLHFVSTTFLFQFRFSGAMVHTCKTKWWNKWNKWNV